MPSPLLAAENRILPALVTPLTADGRLDERSTERLIDHLYAKGVGGLYVTGTTGEGIHFDSQIRRRLVEVAIHASRGRGTLIVHVGATQAAAAFELADHAARTGADAISSIPPFAGGYVWDEIHAFYAELARHSELPVVAYHFPGLTGQQTSLAQLASLLAIPNIAGLKFTDPNFYVMQRLLARLSPEQILYNGQDEALALGLSIGAHGGIGSTYNFMPELIVSIYRHARAGRHAEAIAMQRQANQIIEAALTAQIVAATKQILYWQGLIDCPACAFPRAGLNDAQQRRLRDLLAGTAIAGTLVR
ncbi:MAG: dihydrodipicolinate synthase family protein [Planctomycetaceae bacterium]|nr:dihydrodipicolinate synthase family protein [Planctomycetaceae bacterium]